MHSIPSPTSSPSRERKLSWPDLAATSNFVRRTGWEHRPTPVELTQLPDDTVTTEILQQILTWSLIPGSNWSYPHPSRKPSDAVGSRPKSYCTSGNGVTSNGSINVSIQTQAPPSTSKVPDAVVPSGKTSTSLLSPRYQGSSQDSERSLKDKLLSKIKPTRSAERLPALTPKSESTTVECTSCFEDLPETEMTRLKSCRHWYCKKCLATLIMTAIATEASFPPKCCLSPIPLNQILKSLDTKQRDDYKLKAAEYAVPAADRWYCTSAKCLKWIPSSKLKINKQLSYDCPHCSGKLCRTCRGPAHPTNTECPQDFGLEATLEIAEIEGWQRCYKCRALVEHNKGCRHMTCICGAQFCYACGSRWQTCSCTEADAANKRAGAQHRRQERAQKRDAEAAEIARAIAEIEAMERREAEERQQEEQRRREEEEEQLRVLEAQRLEEEAKRQAAAEQAERDLRKVLLNSFEEEIQQIQELYHKITGFQSAAINLRHEAEDNRLSKMHVKEEEEAKREFDVVGQVLQKNSAKRHSRLAVRQKCNLETLQIQQEEQEDDLFLKLQIRLRGKANEESRMERMLGEIHKQQADDRNELQQRQEKELEELEKKIKFETESLEKWYEANMQRTRDRHTTELLKFGYAVGADRQYFQVVNERRNKMIALHHEKCLQSIASGEEPAGLTEYDASKIEPFLPEFDEGEQGPSGINRGPNMVSTPHGPFAIDRLYNQHSQVTAVPQSKNVPFIRVNTHNLQIERHQQCQSFADPVFPGSFPADVSPVDSAPPLPSRNRLRIPPSHTPPPPPVPISTPPKPPIPTCLTPGGSRSQIPLGKQTTSPLKPQPQLPQHQQYWQQWQTQQQSKQQHQEQQNQHISAAFSAITSTSLVALGIHPQPEHPVRPMQQQRHHHYDPKSAISSVTTLDTLISDSQYERRESLESTPSLTAKKSRWGFRKTKQMTEAEMKREMRAAVGDAFF